MRHALSTNEASRNSQELESLTLSFSKVRILHYAAPEPINHAAILARLRTHGCALSAGTLNQILASMVRNGWLKIKAGPAGTPPGHRAYILTPKGHRVLKMARQQLKQLVAKWFTRTLRG